MDEGALSIRLHSLCLGPALVPLKHVWKRGPVWLQELYMCLCYLWEKLIFESHPQTRPPTTHPTIPNSRFLIGFQTICNVTNHHNQKHHLWLEDLQFVPQSLWFVLLWRPSVAAYQHCEVALTLHSIIQQQNIVILWCKTVQHKLSFV